MSIYLHSIALPPKTLSDQEQAALLEKTGERRGAFRDHILFAMALATALREHELVALDVGDIVDGYGGVRRRVELRVYKKSTAHPMPQVVMLPETLRIKLVRYLDWKKRHGQSLDLSAPLFISRRGTRLSTRQVRYLMAVWKERAQIERDVSFHSTRHAACTNIYRRTKDLLVTQRFARHKSVVSTMRYSHPTEADLLSAVQGQRC